MSLPPLASITDFETRLGTSICGDDGQRERAEALLVDASALVRVTTGQSYVDENGELYNVPDLARAITCGIAMRAFRNPDEIESTQLGAVSVRFRSVWLTGAEAAALANLSRTKGFLSVGMDHGFGWDPSSPYWTACCGGGSGGNYFVPVDYGGQHFGPIAL